MKVKIIELKDAALDYAVAQIEKALPDSFDDWKQTWPFYVTGEPGNHIIDREGITVIRCDDDWGRNADGYCNNKRIPVWAATIGQHNWSSSTEHQSHEPMYQIDVTDVVYGSTRREAAMRAYVAWKNSRSQFNMNVEGTVEIPDEIL